jgi:hypothetical protein
MLDKRPLLVRYGPPLAADDRALPATAPPPASSESATSAPVSRWAVGIDWKPLAVQATALWVASRLLLSIFTLATALLDGVRGKGLTLPVAKARGFSGDACGNPLRSRLMGLPGPTVWWSVV